ncbi:MAG: hypothetical protein JRJ85_17530, partial [Deltaproteobacteria bacterium]|nr:hypothetical protein [Deltaproteobacteria bacterium]
FILEPTDISYEHLDRHPGGIFPFQQFFKKYEENGLPATPSHKVEIYSQQMADMGYDPLPTFHPPMDTDPDSSAEFPLLLITGAKLPGFQNSRFHDVPECCFVPAPSLTIHPDTASGLGIKDRDQVAVETSSGSIKVEAEITETICPGVVSLGQGWGEANVNYLTDDARDRDPVTGFPTFRPLMCKVKNL